LIIKRRFGSVVFENGVPVFQNEPCHHIDAPLKSNTVFIVIICSVHCGFHLSAMNKRFSADRCNQRTVIDASNKLMRMRSILEFDICR